MINTEHEWLRRLSDYHSGGVDDGEAAAVEEHLAECEECREALRIYRRFYLLASSPLRLGEPSDTLAEELRVHEGVSDGFRVSSANLERYLSPGDGMHPERKRVLLGIASVLAASLVIAGFLALLGPRLPGVGTRATPTPLASTTPSAPTPTAQTTNLPAPGTGYINAGPAWATYLAFAPSSPNTAYACGLTVSSSGSGEFLVAVSTDSGHTWQSQASPGILPGILPVVPPLPRNSSLEQFYFCNLAVDRNNPRDVALVDQYCTDAISENPYECKANAESSQLYRSFDGGAAWSLSNSPGGDWVVSHEVLYSEVVWVGTDLFVNTTEGIARSIADGPFTLLQQSYFGSGSQAYEGRQFFVMGSTLIVQSASSTARSDDQGADWSLIPMSYRSTAVSLMLVGADGKTLIGVDNSPSIDPGVRQYLLSKDFGATWSPLPTVPLAVNVTSEGGPFAEAPDGTIFAEFSFFSPPDSSYIGIYELAPGALNWRYFAPPPVGYPRLFLWNNAGHLAAIWGNRGSPFSTSFQYRLFSSQ